MEWFDKWFYKKSRWAWEEGRKLYNSNPRNHPEEDVHELLDGLTIAIKKAKGGYVATFVSQDSRVKNSYIITDEQNLADHIGKLITLELLK
jgi:hypothetical protein